MGLDSAGGVFLPDSPNSLLERGYPEQVRLSMSALAEACPIGPQKWPEAVTLLQTTNFCAWDMLITLLIEHPLPTDFGWTLL